MWNNSIYRISFYPPYIIFRLIKDIDPNAFVSQSAVIGVYGEGFDRIKVK